MAGDKFDYSWIRSRSIRIGLVVAFILAVAAPPVAAGQHALVIGNGDYTNLEPLQSARPAALRVEQLMREKGFTVSMATDATNGAMRAAIQAFAQRLAAGDTAFVFYSGHAFQLMDRNYLVPVNADLRSRLDLIAQAVDIASILNAMQRVPLRLGALFIDAAFETDFAKSGDGMKGGLAPIEVDTNDWVVMLAAQPNRVFPIRPGQTTLFGRALITELSKLDTMLDTLIDSVAERVRRASAGRQTVWVSSTLTGAPVPLREPEPGASPTPTVQAPPPTPTVPSPAAAEPPAIPPGDTPRRTGADTILWETIADSTDPGVFAAFLARYPDSRHAAAAQERLTALRERQPPATPSTYDLSALIAFDQTLSYEERAKVQRHLREMGLYDGAVDGVFGTGTRSAIRAFQERGGSRRTGYLTPEELDSLLR